MSSRIMLQRWVPILVMFGFGIVMLRGYVTDDTWIHLRYARHLIELGELSFNPGVPTYGATSPLWILGIVMLLKVGVAPLLATKVLGIASGLLALAVACRLILRVDMPESWRPWVMALVVVDAWFQRWTMSGMETPLAGALLLVLLLPVLSRGRVPWFAWGVAGALAGLTRPEFNLLVLVAVPWLAWREKRNHPDVSVIRGPLLALLGWAILYGPWLWYAWESFGRFTPETAAAKSYAVTFDPRFVIPHLMRTVQQFAIVQGFLWLVAAYVITHWWMRWRPQGGDPRIGPHTVALTGIVGSWLAVLAGGYAVKQVWIISRYVSPLLAPMLLVMVAWAGPVVPRYTSNRRGTERIMATCALLALAGNALVLNLHVRPHSEQFSAGIEKCFYGMGEWLRENTPEDAVIAAHDIGAIGYASERRILDLAGLVSPEILELGREMTFEAMVESGVWLTAEVPDYVYDRTQGPPRWENAVMYGVGFELVATCVVDGVGLRESEPWTYSLYRLTETRPPVDAEAVLLED